MANITHKEQINSFRRALLSSDPFDSQEEEEDEEDEEDEVVEKIEETGEFSYFVPRRTEETTQDIPYYDRQLKNFRSALTTPDEIKLEKSVLNYDDRYPVNPKSIPPGDISYIKTLDDFIKNKTINQVAYDFFQEMGEEGKATDMAYYFRKEISIDDMIRRMNQSKKWSNKQKERYMLLKETFDNTSWSDSSFQQKFKSVRQYGWQAMSDPSMIVAMLLAPFTGGGSIAARTGATETGKFMIRQAVANTMRSGLTKKNVHSLARSFVSTPAKSTATFTGAFSGVMNRLNQEVEMQLDPEKKGVNYTEWATHTGLGIVLGAGLAKGIEKIPVVTAPIKNAIAKVYEKTDELTGQKLTASVEVMQQHIDFGMGRSFSPAVVEYKVPAKYSSDLKSMLESVNAKALIRTYQQAQEKIPNTYTDDAWSLTGKLVAELTDILEPLKSGARTRIQQAKIQKKSTLDQLRGGWKGLDRIDDETNKLLSEAVRGGMFEKQPGITSVKISKEIINAANKYGYTVSDFTKAAIGLRRLDDAAFEIAVKSGLPLKHVKNHFPRVYSKYLNTDEGQEIFIKELLRSKQVDSRQQAKQLIDEMLDKSDRFGLGSNINSRFARTIDKIDDTKITDILDNNVEEVFRKYFWDIAKLSAEARHGGIPKLPTMLIKGKKGFIVGENTRGLGKKIYDKTKVGGTIEQQLKAAGKEHLISRKDLKRLEKMWKFTIGDLPQLEGKARLASEAWQVVTQVATLPLATLTSLSEVFVPLTRIDAPNYVYNLTKVMAVRSQNTARHMYKAVAVNKTPKWLTKSETLRDANSVFVALDLATMQRLDSIFAGDIKNPMLKGVQRGFFRLNLLAEWTKTVELASYMMGKDLIKKNARKLAKGGYSKPSIERYTLELNELNIDIPTAIKWANGQLAKEQKLLFERQINEGGGRFARQVILNPKKAGLTSLWLQDPRYNVLTQLLSYPYAFGNTIMKRFAQGMLQGPVQSGQALVGGTLMAMTGIMGNEWRTQGERTWGKRSDAEVISEGIKRVGGLGMLEYVWRGFQQLEYSQYGGLIKLLKMTPLMGSPTGSDFIDYLTGTKSMLEIIVTKSPGFYAYSKPVQRKLIKWAKENSAESRDKMYRLLKSKGVTKPEQLGYPKRKPQFEGGAISEDFPVPNVAADPSERIDPNTGLPYDEPLERLGFSGGGLLNGVEDPLARLGFTGGGGLMVSIGVAPVSEKQMSKFEKALKKRKAKRDGGYTREQYFLGSIGDVAKQQLEINPKDRWEIESMKNIDEDANALALWLQVPTKTEAEIERDEDRAEQERQGIIDSNQQSVLFSFPGVTSLRDALEIRQAKRDGGRIGFQEGTPTMEEITVTARMPSLQRRLKERAPRYGQQRPASWERYPTLRSDWKPIDPGKFAEWGGANMPITDEQYEEWGKQGYSYDDIQESLKDIAIANEKAWDEFVKTSVLDEATGQRYSQEEWKKMQRIGSKERKLAKKLKKATKKAATEKRDKEASGGRIGFAEGSISLLEVLGRRKGKFLLEEDIISSDAFATHSEKEFQKALKEGISKRAAVAVSKDKGLPARLKETSMKDLVAAQKEYGKPIYLADSTVGKDYKIERQNLYYRNLKDYKRQGYYNDPEGNKITSQPPYQKGGDSYHVEGQAIDLNQPYYRDYNRKELAELIPILGKYGFVQDDKEEWHFSQGEQSQRNIFR